jgi:hypothetical protein
MTARAIRTIVSLMFTGWLAACGGGGTEESPVPPPQYSGNTSPAAVSLASAPALADAAMGALLLATGLGGEVLGETADTGNIDVTVDGTDGGTATLQGSIRDGQGTLTLTYRQYREADLTLNGQEVIVILAQRTDPVAGVYNSQVRHSYNGLTVQVSGEAPYTLGGSITTQQTQPPGTSGGLKDAAMSGELIIETTTPARQVRITDMALTHTLSASVNTEAQRWTIGGTARVYDSVSGYVDLRFESPLLVRVADPVNGPAYAGSVVLTGAAGAFFWVSPLTRDMVALEFDVSGDGTPDRTLSFRWAEGFSRPAANRAGPVAITGANVTLASDATGVPFRLEGRFSENSTATFLSHQWTLALAPPGSTATIAGADTARASITPDVRGSYLFRLTVSDGTQSTFDYLTLRVSLPGEATPAGEENTGTRIVLEPDLVAAAGTSLVLDGSRSFTFDGTPLQNPGWQLLELPPTGSGGSSTTRQYTVTLTASTAVTQAAFSAQRLQSGIPPSSDHLRILPPTNRRMAPTVQLPGMVAGVSDNSRVGGVADFNGDGIDDFLLHRGDPTASTQNRLLRVMLGASDGRLRRYGDELLLEDAFQPTQYPRVIIGDLNGDARPDIVVPDNAGLGYFLNTGTPGMPFATLVKVAGTCGAHAIRLVDADGDGDLDALARESCTTQGMMLFVNQGGVLSTAQPVTFSGATQVLSVFAALDLNADNRSDLVGVSEFGAMSTWLATPTSGAYVPGPALPQELTMFAGQNVILAAGQLVGDLDGNGRPDLVLNGIAAGAVMQATDGALTFRPLQAQPGFGLVGLRDFDGDGRRDVLGQGFWVRQAADGSFAAAQTYSRGGANGAGDFNGDGRIDLIQDSSMLTLQAPPP